MSRVIAGYHRRERWRRLEFLRKLRFQNQISGRRVALNFCRRNFPRCRCVSYAFRHNDDVRCLCRVRQNTKNQSPASTLLAGFFLSLALPSFAGFAGIACCAPNPSHRPNRVPSRLCLRSLLPRREEFCAQARCEFNPDGVPVFEEQWKLFLARCDLRFLTKNSAGRPPTTKAKCQRTGNHIIRPPTTKATRAADRNVSDRSPRRNRDN